MRRVRHTSALEHLARPSERGIGTLGVPGGAVAAADEARNVSRKARLHVQQMQPQVMVASIVIAWRSAFSPFSVPSMGTSTFSI